MIVILAYILIIVGTLRTPHKNQVPSLTYYSAKEDTHTFVLPRLVQHKPLVLVNKIDSRLSISYPKSNCNMNQRTDYCLIQNVTTSQLSVQAKCSTLPCQISLEVYQPDLVEHSTSPVPLNSKQVYIIDQQAVLVTFTCNNTQLTDFSSEITLRTGTNYSLISRQGKLYILFDTKVHDLVVEATLAATKCGQVSIEISPGRFQMNSTRKVVVGSNKTFEVAGYTGEDLQVHLQLLKGGKSVSNVMVSIFPGSNLTNILSVANVSLQDDPIVLKLVVPRQQLSSLAGNSIHINIQTSNHTLFGTIYCSQNVIHPLEVGQPAYLKLLQTQTLDFTVQKTAKEPDLNVSSFMTGEVQFSRGKTTTINDLHLQGCDATKCAFTLKALQDTQGYIVVTTKATTGDIPYQEITGQLELRMNKDQAKYLLYKVKNRVETLSVSVSSPNAVLYSAGKNCPRPSDTCHESSGTSLSPMGVQTQENSLYIGVYALQTVDLTVRVYDSLSKYIQLKASTPTHIQMSNDTEVVFQFNLKEVSTVYFNLACSPSMFVMYISNNRSAPDNNTLYKSSSFLRIDREDVVQLMFTIIVKRIGAQLNERFTLLCSTSQSIVTLDKSVPYYDTFGVGEVKYYLIILSPQKTSIGLNMVMAPNLPSINFTMRFGPRKDSMTHNVSVVTSNSLLVLGEQVEKICQQQDNQNFCEVFVQAENTFNKELDVTLTVLVQSGIVQLRSGIWQSYSMGEATKSTRFYFVPRNKKNIIVELSNSLLVYQLTCKLWHNQNKVLNKQVWPFPNSSGHSNKNSLTLYSREVEKCFPNCLVLITVTYSKFQDENVIPVDSLVGTYSIMASDHNVMLQQNIPNTVVLSSKESKYYTVDISKHLDDEIGVLTFITTRITGNYSLLARVCDDEYEAPDQSNYDYKLDQQITQIKVKDIRESHPEGKTLILTANSVEQSVFSLTLITSTSVARQLFFSVPLTVSLEPRTSETFRVQYWKGFRVKIIRTNGFPFISHSECTKDSLQECLTNLDKNQTQVISRLQEIKFDNQTVLIKVFTKNQASLFQLLAISDGMNVRLSEGSIHSDFGSMMQLNRYTITTTRTKKTSVFVTVYEGSPIVSIMSQLDNFQIKGVKNGNLIHYNIFPSMFKQNQDQSAQLTLSIRDQHTNCSFSIFYTSQGVVELIDGLVTSGTIKKGQTMRYLYNNKINDKVVVTIQFGSAEMMSGCVINTKLSEEASTRILSKLVQQRANPTKPTMSFQLEQNHTSYQISLLNNKLSQVNYNITISYVNLAILPSGFQYPLALNPGDTKTFIINVLNQAYVQFTIKKCSSSDLLFSYTHNKQDLRNQVLENQLGIEQNHFVSRMHMKASTLFAKVSSVSGVLMSIKVDFDKDARGQSVKPGNKGYVTYQIVEYHKASVTFTPVVCRQKCPSNIEYEYVLGTAFEDVETHTLCPSTMFLMRQVQPQITHKIKPAKTGRHGQLSFTIPITEDVHYLGLRAIMPDSRQIVYQVIEVSTVWGQLKKHSTYQIPATLLTMLTVVGCCLVCLKRLNAKKRKYSSVPDA